MTTDDDEFRLAGQRVAGARLNVLVADDNEDHREALANAVRILGHSCRVAADGLEAWRIHQADPADVIVSDWRMPRMNGLELCKRTREAEGDHYTHFILVTARHEKASFLEGMRAGADDYLTKPVDIDELQARLRAAFRATVARRELEDSNRTLRRESEHSLLVARTDPLTLAGNRMHLQEDLEGIVDRARRYGHRYCAAFCDIDWFKSYNDAFGHLAGDEAIKTTSRMIQEQLRRGDGFYRYGGDEFLVLLPEQTLGSASECMDRVCRSVAGIPDIGHGGPLERPVTVSIGIAELVVTTAEDSIPSWLRRADHALYRAKQLGRNRVEVDPLRLSSRPPVSAP